MVVSVAMLEQNRLDVRMPAEDGHQFRAAVAAESNNANGSHGQVFKDCNKRSQDWRPTALLRGRPSAKIANPAAKPSAPSMRKNDSRDIFS